MKIRVKIFVLLTICLSMFVALIFIYRGVDANRLRILFQQEGNQEIETTQRVLGIAGNSLETLAFDYTFWDEMVRFVTKVDKTWAATNIDVNLQTFKANGTWIYNTDGALVYSVDNVGGEFFAKSPLPEEEVKKIFEKSRFTHFFVGTPAGPMEIRGATIHLSNDVERKSDPRGFFLAGRIWDKNYLETLSKITAAEIRLCRRGEEGSAIIMEPKKGLVVFHKSLEDWRGRPVNWVKISTYSAISEVFMKDSRRMLIILLIYLGVIFVVLYLALILWINAPMKSILLALSQKDIAGIEKMKRVGDEFGQIAKLIDEFFQQRNNLVSEIAKRKRSDMALTDKIKELEEAYKRLRDMQYSMIQSEKLAALGRFASGVAHEVRNPLAIILGGLDYLRIKLPGADPDVREAMTKLREAVLRAEKIVNDLLSFSRPSKAVFEVAHPSGLVNEALSFLELFKHKSDTAQINMHLELTEKDIGVEVDKNQIQQVLFNILLNAVEATPMVGDIYVKTYTDMMVIPLAGHEKREVCVIEIRDTGMGIPKENLKKIFEPFFTTKSHQHGTGLGLPIVKSIIERHKGSITIESESGKGTTVRIALAVKEKMKLKNGG